MTLGDWGAGGGKRKGIPSKKNLLLYLPKCFSKLNAAKLAREAGGDLIVCVVGHPCGHEPCQSYHVTKQGRIVYP